MAFNFLKNLGPKKQISRIIGGNRPDYTKISTFFRKKIIDINSQIIDARQKLKDIPGTNMELGLFHMRKGNLDDAVMRFKMVIFLKPEVKDAYFYLARCLIAKGEMENARKQLDKIADYSKFKEDIAYLLRKINQPEEIKEIPDNIIQEKSENLADIYNNEGIGESELIERDMLIKSIMRNINDKNPNLEVLDIGCGAGIYGHMLKEKDVVKSIKGIEISPKLADRARNLKIKGEAVYREVENVSCNQFLLGASGNYDLILLDRVLEYYGNIGDILRKLSGLLKQDGIIGFLKDKPELDKSYKLKVESDIFEHSLQEIKEKIQIEGLKEVEIKEVELIEGYQQIIFVIKK